MMNETPEKGENQYTKARKRRKAMKAAPYPKAPSDMIADWLAAGNKIKVGPVRYAVPSQQGCK